MSDNTSLFDWMIHVGDKLSAHATLGVIPVITEFPKSRAPGEGFVQQLHKLTKALTGQNGKSGLAIYVTMARTIGVSDKAQSITTQGALYVSALESRIYNANPQTGFAPNGIGLHADDVAVAAARVLQNWQDGAVADHARVQDIISDHEGWLPPDVREQNAKFDLYCTAFQVSALMTWAQPGRCYVPLITIAGGHATITGNTAGATYLCTLDGSYPCPANAAATYSVPVAVTSGQIVTAVATKSGNDDSDVARAVVP